MFEKKIAKYKSLNQLAEADGTVIFGTSSDVNIPNKYTQTTSTNFNVFESEIYYDAIDDYINNGDEALDSYFNMIG